MPRAGEPAPFRSKLRDSIGILVNFLMDRRTRRELPPEIWNQLYTACARAKAHLKPNFTCAGEPKIKENLDD